MTDIVDRLRHWSHGLTYDPAVGLMHEAATEIARLRLTDEEREAINVARIELNTLHCFEEHHSHVLLRLLARLA